MKITRLRISNYRSIQDVRIEFPTFYTAICGRNDAGKTNILRALRAIVNERETPFFTQATEVSSKDDWPKWDATDRKERTIKLSMDCTVFPDADEGLHRFLIDYLNIGPTFEALSVSISNNYGDAGGKSVTVIVNGVAQEGIKAQEVAKKFESGTVLFHNSTEALPAIFARQGTNLLEDLSEVDSQPLLKAKDSLNSQIRKLAKRQERELEELLGRLQQKYKVAVSTPEFEMSGLPLSINLGDDSANVPLENWGSGTQNRTKILLALFKAKRVGQSETSAAKITPVLVIEEPESFLHPSAQAEFGSVIQELSEEFKVQVIVTTHSPHLLSHRTPQANVLLQRRTDRNKLRETSVQDCSGENWMHPFAFALGIGVELFAPWKELLVNGSDTVLLVEGETDQRYLEFLRDIRHGDKRLRFSGPILPYQGKDTLKAGSILRFVREHFKKCVLTYDLDAEQQISPALVIAGFKIGVDAIAVGLNLPGKKDIEGLIPSTIGAKVYAENPDLVTQGMSAVTEERKSAKNSLKAKLLEQVRTVPLPNDDVFKAFHALARKIDKAFESVEVPRPKVKVASTLQ